MQNPRMEQPMQDAVVLDAAAGGGGNVGSSAVGHHGACPLAPCFCTEPGCTFAAPPLNLVPHLNADHAWPAYGVAYRKVYKLRAPLSGPRRLLLGEDDRRVFALVVAEQGALTAAVSVVCVRAGDGEPRYRASLLAAGLAGITFKMESMVVASSARPGEVAVEDLPGFLAVPLTHLLPGPDGASKELSLKICIEKIS